MDITQLSNEDLQKEIKRREIEMENLKQKQIESLTPKKVENPNLESLTAICQEYIDSRIKNGWVDDDLSHYIFETAIETIFGKDSFKKLHEIERLKSKKKR